MRKIALGLVVLLAAVSAVNADLITNGTFNTAVTSWTFNKTGESIPDAVLALTIANNPSSPAGFWTAGSKVARLQLNKSANNTGDATGDYTAGTVYAFQRITIPTSGNWQITGKFGTTNANGWAGVFFYKDTSDGTAAGVETQIATFLPAGLSPAYGGGGHTMPATHSVNLYTSAPQIVVEANTNTGISNNPANTFAAYTADAHTYNGIADLTPRQTRAAVAGEHWVVGFFGLNSDVNNGARESFFFDEIAVNQVVPEPAAIVLLSLGALPLLRRRR